MLKNFLYLVLLVTVFSGCSNNDYCRTSVVENAYVGFLSTEIIAKFGEPDNKYSSYFKIGTEQEHPPPAGAITYQYENSEGYLYIWLKPKLSENGEKQYICYKSLWFTYDVAF